MKSQNNFYDSIHDYVKGTTMAAWVFWLSMVLLLIGINNFWEDTYSSYIGVQQIEKTFQVKAVSWWVTYVGMSLAFQVITVLAGVAYLSDRKKYWLAGYIAIGAQLIDFVADVWYRANGVWVGWASVSVSFVLTFVFFTVGSEVALTVGLGLVARLLVEGLAQTGILVRNMFAGIGRLAQILASGEATGKGSTHSDITHALDDVRYKGGGNQGGGKPQGGGGNQGGGNKGGDGGNKGGGKPQVSNISLQHKYIGNQNQKPTWKPAQGGGGEDADTEEGIDPETLRQLFTGNRNSDGSPRSTRRDNPFRGGGKG